MIGTTETDESPEPVDGCNAAGFTGSFTFIAVESYDGGSLECTAFNNGNAAVGTTVKIALELFSKFILLFSNAAISKQSFSLVHSNVTIH